MNFPSLAMKFVTERARLYLRTRTGLAQLLSVIAASISMERMLANIAYPNHVKPWWGIGSVMSISTSIVAVLLSTALVLVCYEDRHTGHRGRRGRAGVRGARGTRGRRADKGNIDRR